MVSLNQSISMLNRSLTTIGTDSSTFLIESTTQQINLVKFSAYISGFTVLILATVLGNTLVLAALFLDKRLHSPSFLLIANMATADLLLGISVLPFSSLLEILDGRWIFGQGFCSAWLALDVLCCTASIIALMAVSVDRYIGVTRPLKYGRIMTIRRTIYLIILVWAVSILTSVVPLFGLTDRGKKIKDSTITLEEYETCNVNKNTFYTIFSSSVSFYIPVVILLILYSRVYQEAKIQGEKLENEKRRLYQIEYQIAAEQARQQQNNANGHVEQTHTEPNTCNNPINETVSKSLLNSDEFSNEDDPLELSVVSTNGKFLEANGSEAKIQRNDDLSHSAASLTVTPTLNKSRSWTRRLISSVKSSRTANVLHSPNSHRHRYLSHGSITPTDELTAIKHKLQNLKREKKAFRTLVIILGALLLFWLPFFVTLPVMSILKHFGMIKDENTGNTWFKITFWLGYCNSACNPFIYAFSNRAIRRAFRQVIFRRCCWICKKKTSRQAKIRFRTSSGPMTADGSQTFDRRASSINIDHAPRKTVRTLPDPNKIEAHANTKPVVSFTCLLNEITDETKSVNQQLFNDDTKSTSNLREHS